MRTFLLLTALILNLSSAQSASLLADLDRHSLAQKIEELHGRLDHSLTEEDRQFEKQAEKAAKEQWDRKSALEKKNSPWSDWYYKPVAFAILQLAGIRNHLDKNNLFDTNSMAPANVTCGEASLEARTINGTCNDLKQPWMGAAGVRFGRNIPLNEVHDVSESELLTPNPRTISLELMTRKEFKPVPFLNMFAAMWIQFMVHDWVNHRTDEHTQPFSIPLAKNDPSGQSEMLVLRTETDPTRSGMDKKLPQTYINENTHWWDGSQLYGSDLTTHQKIRSFKDGMLLVDSKGLLPIDHDKVEVTGFKRNWWLGLSLMHHLFVSEHNAIAQMLKNKNPSWNDEKLFNKARLINTALMAKIHTVEWTPAILHNKTLRTAMHANWYGLLNGTEKALAGFEFIKDPIVSGLIGAKKELNGVPFSLTEEFVSVYRLHPLLPEELIIKNTDGKVLTTIPTEETRDEKSNAFTNKYEMHDLLFSMGTMLPGQLVLNNYPAFLQNLNRPLLGKVDLAAVDILRDRERGVPRYNRFRKLLSLKPITKFEDLTDDKETIQKLKKVYSNDVEQLDLLVGCLAEAHRPTGYGFGETAFQIFILMASRRLHADRFYTDSYNAKVYTQEGLDWVDQNTFKSVLLRHHPKLRASMGHINNAFRPWK